MRNAFLLTVALLLIGGIGLATDDVGRANIEVVPPDPVEGDEVTLVLSGRWPDSCVPHAHRTLRLAGFITIQLVTLSPPCWPVVTEWEREISLGALSPGSYLVSVAHDRDDIGQASFTVGERVEEPVEDPVEEENDVWVIPEEPERLCENPYAPPLALLLSTMDEVAWGETLPMALVVTTTTGEHDFLFGSGQRYDFAVYLDEQEVWRWSDDRAFPMVVGEDTYTTEGELFLERLDTRELPGPGTYTLQGTLAAEGMVEGDRLQDRGPAHVCTTFQLLAVTEVPEECIDINTASFEELQQIVHIGPARAGELIALREEAPFTSLDELQRLTGIGPARVADIKEQGLACVVEDFTSP